MNQKGHLIEKRDRSLNKIDVPVDKENLLHSN